MAATAICNRRCSAWCCRCLIEANAARLSAGTLAPASREFQRRLGPLEGAAPRRFLGHTMGVAVVAARVILSGCATSASQVRCLRRRGLVCVIGCYRCVTMHESALPPQRAVVARPASRKVYGLSSPRHSRYCEGGAARRGAGHSAPLLWSHSDRFGGRLGVDLKPSVGRLGIELRSMRRPLRVVLGSTRGAL